MRYYQRDENPAMDGSIVVAPSINSQCKHFKTSFLQINTEIPPEIIFSEIYKHAKNPAIDKKNS